MVKTGKEKVVVSLDGFQIPFLVNHEDEPYFRDAKEILNDRLAVLKSDYSAHASSENLVAVLAVEALVDALKINERYQKLKDEIQIRLDNIQIRFEN
jgi:cell division protein ZapA (FtsZ GTPase activity inhibitor)